MLTSQLLDLKLTYRADWEGNRLTTATYRDPDGTHRSTQLNGHVHEQGVRASIQQYRARNTP